MAKLNMFIIVLLCLFGIVNFTNNYHFAVFTGNINRDGVFIGHQIHNMSHDKVIEITEVQLSLRKNVLVESNLAEYLLENKNCNYFDELKSNLIYYKNCQDSIKFKKNLDIMYLSDELYYLEELILEMEKMCYESN